MVEFIISCKLLEIRNNNCLVKTKKANKEEYNLFKKNEESIYLSFKLKNDWKKNWKSHPFLFIFLKYEKETKTVWLLGKRTDGFDYVLSEKMSVKNSQKMAEEEFADIIVAEAL